MPLLFSMDLNLKPKATTSLLYGFALLELECCHLFYENNIYMMEFS